MRSGFARAGFLRVGFLLRWGLGRGRDVLLGHAGGWRVSVGCLIFVAALFDYGVVGVWVSQCD